MDRDFIRDLLKRMFNGWRLHEQSWDDEESKYTRSEEECMIEACGGDQNAGLLLKLFDYWSNDIQDIAAHYGIGFAEDGSVRDDIPPAPSLDHWWRNHKWNEPWSDLSKTEISRA